MSYMRFTGSLGIIGMCWILMFCQQSWSRNPESPVVIETRCVRYVISPEAQNLHFVDKQTGDDFMIQGPAAWVKKSGQDHPATSACYQEGILHIGFASAEINVKVQVLIKDRYFILKVLDVTDMGLEELQFCNIQLSLKPEQQESIAACLLALNLQTKVDLVPKPSRDLKAKCFSRFGIIGAEAAVIGCPPSQLRDVMKEVITGAEKLPHNINGGPWAMDYPINRGSYLLNFGNVTESTVDEWIQLLKDLGFTQLDFHGGQSFRFGDCVLNPQMYPQGFADLKYVIDKLHEAGISAGLHTYAMFIDKKCPWVTPVPDPRLGKNAMFTLAKSLTKNDTLITVHETTRDLSTDIAFHKRNSVTLQIDDELITYAGIRKEPPYAFKECQRGACGTTAADHVAGAKVYHLKECFGLFVPDGDSSLLTEVAAKTAEIYNQCNFDMIYLDALDGSDIIAGSENSWHYSAKFVFEIVQRLNRPALMEMSTFNHHLWYVRSRLGAWDCSYRGHKRYVDLHCKWNTAGDRNYLPKALGWYRINTWTGPHNEPTYPDDIEYLCSKALGHDFYLSLMGIDPDSFKKSPYRQRLASIFKNYETLRLQNYFSEGIKEKLCQPGQEFTLEQNSQGQWQFRPIRYDKHKVENIDGVSNVWDVENPFEPQPIRLRIEALMSTGSYDGKENPVVVEFDDKNNPWQNHACAEGISVDFDVSKEQVKEGLPSGKLTASNTLSQRKGAWTKLIRQFSPPINLSEHQGLGVWINGDGKGEILNFQLINPSYLHLGTADHYVPVDFTGWRYVELIERDSDCYADIDWTSDHLDNFNNPKTIDMLISLFEIYVNNVDYHRIDSLNVWFRHLPPEGSATCYLGPIRAISLIDNKLIHPQITINDATLVFPVEIETGSYLEFYPPSEGLLYDKEGKLIQKVAGQGEVPMLKTGMNSVQFHCTGQAPANPRAYVTLSVQGEPLPNE